MTDANIPSRNRLSVVSKEPIHGQILPHIRRDIVMNRWAPGERLPEMELCAEFGVSRTPLRDVLKILEVDGLVELVPHVGAVVTRLDPPDLADKLEVLNGLEQTAAMKVAAKRPPEVLAEIGRLHGEMGSAAAEKRIEDYYELNDEFHRTIVLGANNPTLARMHEVMMWHVSRARHRANENEPLTESQAEHHAGIVAAIMSGAVEAAGKAMRDHLAEVGQLILARTESWAAGERETARGRTRGEKAGKRVAK